MSHQLKSSFIRVLHNKVHADLDAINNSSSIKDNIGLKTSFNVLEMALEETISKLDAGLLCLNNWKVYIDNKDIN